ncbi:MAG: RIP metalloprotease RseP [Clostridiales bacterium]|nr:RIP metalloprotease RseP [Clostridiales bacterium]
MIFIHELGHFLAAKLMGVRVNKFAIGFGPVLLRWGKGETEYSLRLLPLGGFCAMEGEDEESADQRAFCNKKPWRRFIITAAGAFFNILLGFIIMMIILIPQKQFGVPKIAQFQENAVSQQSGLQVGDEFIKVNGRRILTTYDLSYTFSNIPADGKVDLVVKRDGKKLELSGVTFATEEIQGVNVVSIDFWIEGVKKTPLNFLSEAFRNTLSYGRIVWWSLLDLITGKYGVSQISGPVGVTAAIGEAAKAGIFSLLPMVGLITINLGLFNLLPLPALDGGRLLFIIIEMVRRKPVPQKYEGMVHAIGFMVLMAFMVLIALKDIFQLFAG